jgi:hypothetical protein
LKKEKGKTKRRMEKKGYVEQKRKPRLWRKVRERITKEEVEKGGE